MNASIDTLLQRPDIWLIGQLPSSTRTAISSGFNALDQALPDHGWEQGALTEILSNEQGIGELSLLIPALRQVSQSGKGILLVAPPFIPFPQAWAAHDINLQQVVIVRAHKNDQLWAMEQAARSDSCGMVIGWAANQRGLGLNYQALRRLHVAATAGGTALILYRPLQAADEASPAPTRVTVSTHNGYLQMRLIKRRASLMSTEIRLPIYPAHWARRRNEISETERTKSNAKFSFVSLIHPSASPQRHALR
ncbi:MAG: translesion DNA synthesis-associated protein ImuA [Burkholderiales bacterium]